MEIQEIKATKPSRHVSGHSKGGLRVAAYCRVSTDDEEQLNSYDSQKTYYSDLILNNKNWKYVGVYADAALTGTQVKNRVDFQRLINDSMDGKIDMIITKSISRFARNTYDTLKFVRMLKEKGVAIFFEEENINTMTMDGELLLTILSSVAQQEVANISENVKKGLKMKMKRGELVGFQGCIGYDYDKETKSISVNRDEAEIVEYIFERYVEGYGATVIARELNEKGYKTKKGNSWEHSSIIRIIRNEKYIGDLLMGKSYTVDPISKRRLSNNGEEDKYYIKDHHEPIIDRDTYYKAHELLNKRSFVRKPKGSNVTREKYSRKYAFSSKLECGFCSSNLSRRAWHSNSKYKKTIWQCMTNSKKGKKNCEHSKGIPEEIIELAFLESYARISGKDRGLVEGFVETVETTLGVESVSKEMKKLQRKKDEIFNKKKKLLELVLEEKLDEDLFQSSVENYKEMEQSIDDELEQLSLKLEYEVELTKRIDTLKKTLKNNIKLDEFDRYIFENLIEKVIVGKTDEDGNVDPYNITFIYKTGLDNTINGEKYRKDGRRKKNKPLPSNTVKEVTVLPSKIGNDACREYCTSHQKLINKIKLLLIIQKEFFNR